MLAAGCCCLLVVRSASRFVGGVSRSGGFRSRRSSQRVRGSVLGQWFDPLVSRCSLNAASARHPASFHASA